MAYDVSEIDNVKWECVLCRACASDPEISEVVTTHRDEDIMLALFGEEEEAGLPTRSYI
jgi:hypothetical protein